MRRQDLLKGCALLFDVFRARVVGARIHAAGNPTPRVLPGGECSELMDESKHLRATAESDGRIAGGDASADWPRCVPGVRLSPSGLA